MLHDKAAESIHGMVADGAVGKLRDGACQFFCLAGEKPVCRGFVAEVKNAMEQTKLHHKPRMIESETRADAVAAHGIIVGHGNQVPVVVFKHLAVEFRVVIVRQDESLFVIPQFVGVCCSAVSLHIVCHKQICVENIKFQIRDYGVTISSKNH